MNINGDVHGCNWSKILLYLSIHIFKLTVDFQVYIYIYIYKTPSKFISTKYFFLYYNISRRFYRVLHNNAQKEYCMKSHVTSAEAKFSFGAT